MHTSFFCVFFLLSFITYAQSPVSYKLFDLPGNEVVSAIELSPDEKFLAIGTSKGPLYFWDWKKQEVIKTIDVGDYYAGPKLRFSKDGKYLMLQQQYYVDWNLNKDKPGRVEVMEVSSGKMLFTNETIHSASFAKGTTLVVLQGADICVWDFLTGQKNKCNSIPNTANTVEVSPDGKMIALSKKPLASDLSEIPTLRSDKTAQKEALKRREIVVFYDLEKLTLIRTCSDVFDIVYSMRFSDDGERLFVYNAPHTRLQTGAGRQGYINRIKVATGEVTRAIYSSLIAEPDYKENADGSQFGNTSAEYKYKTIPQIVLCDPETANPVDRFEINVRIGETAVADRTSFAFLPDGETIALGYGAKMALWKPKTN